MTLNRFHQSLAVVALVTFAAAAQAAPAFRETFSEDFNSPAPSSDAEGDYPAFHFVTTDPVHFSDTVSAAGELELTPTFGFDGSSAFLTDHSYLEEVKASADMTVSEFAGSYAVGVAVGNRAFVFFPGFAGGALRVYAFDPSSGAWGSSLAGTTNMGINPALDVMHRMTVLSYGDGTFDVTVEDGGSAASYSRSYTLAGFTPGVVGMTMKSFDARIDSAARFDNFEALSVPEPTSAMLIGVPLLLVVRSRRR